MNYTIEGGTLPTLILNLEAGETIMTEGGAMSWMSPNMLMETTTNGGFGKMMGRMFSGEKLFMNRYTAQGGPGMIAMASSLPGSIKPFEIVPGRELICQKSSFLSCTPAFSSFPEKAWSRFLWRRRIYYAEIIRSGTCIY